MRLTPYSWAILSVLLLAAPDIAAQSAAAASATPPLTFDQYKTAGDRARLKRNWQDALDAYGKALQIRYDAIVMGQAGLILAQLERYDLAAPLLRRAYEDTTADMPHALRQRISSEFLRSSSETCRVDVHIDQTNARVEIDGIERGDKRADFFVYLNPGVHTIFVEKPGFHDAVTTFVTERNTTLKIAPIMQPVPIEHLWLDKDRKVVWRNPDDVVDVRESRAWSRVLYDAKLQTNRNKPGLKRWFVGGVGVWIPFYVTPGLAAGGQLYGGLRLHSNFEMGLEAKGGVHFSGLKGADILTVGSAYAWSLGLAPCGRFFDRLFLCALLQRNGGNRFSGLWDAWAEFGFGGRFGWEFHLPNHRHLRIFADFVGYLEPPAYRWGEVTFWVGPRATPSAGAIVTF